jgi:hypothetical protein
MYRGIKGLDRFAKFGKVVEFTGKEKQSGKVNGHLTREQSLLLFGYGIHRQQLLGYGS